MGRGKLRKMRKGPGSLPTDALYTLQSLVEGLPELGDRPAVLALHKEGAERWSYGELADHALRLAHGLAGAGVERGDRVTLFAPNRPEWVAACLAVIRAGAVAVPLDAQLGEEALEDILESSEAKLIFTTSEKADLLKRLGTDASPVLLDAADDDERGWRRLLADADTELPEVEPEDGAALFYTSGTTGAAKGVPEV
jgi:long-chain acyl-CoA synthetase